MADTELNARARRILRTLVTEYIQGGTPVGSRTLAKRSRLDLSPASIRNVMSDLEEEGLVSSPHTSAGRVPTARGYRFFVDTLLRMDPLSEAEVERLSVGIEAGEDARAVVSSTGSLLSELTHFVGLVSVPSSNRLGFRHVDFVQLEDDRLLVILVFTDKQVQNRIVRTRRPYTRSELEQAANYLNRHYAGKTLPEIKSKLVRELRQARDSMQQVMSAAVELAESGVSNRDGDDLVLAGQSKLMGIEDLSDVTTLKNLFRQFEEKRDLLELLESTLHSKGVSVFIGEESQFEALGDCSLVTAPYETGGDVVGVLGVIGPTRMAYDRIIPVVDATAKIVSSVLNRGT